MQSFSKQILARFRKKLASVYIIKVLYLSLFLLIRKLFYFLRTWPKPIGRSPMEKMLLREITVRKFLAQNNRQSNLAILFLGSSLRTAVEADGRRIRNNTAALAEFQPICFSWPQTDLKLSASGNRNQEISHVIPWHAYSFDSYSDYLEQYARSKYAMTFKKGGWDCFRHIEIMATNAIPFMPDIRYCPELTMHYYPKALMLRTLEVVRDGFDAFAELQSYQSEWFLQHLTSEQMSKKILETVGSIPKKIYFADPGLNSQPDYLSVQVYCGLKTLLGKEAVTAVHGAASVFEDWQGDATKLHGLGFGYTRLLPISSRNSAESENPSTLGEIIKSAGTQDLIVIGDSSRNLEIAQRFSSDKSIRAKMIFLWGADQSPDRRERKWLARLNGMKFVREIY